MIQYVFFSHWAMINIFLKIFLEICYFQKPLNCMKMNAFFQKNSRVDNCYFTKSELYHQLISLLRDLFILPLSLPSHHIFCHKTCFQKALKNPAIWVWFELKIDAKVSCNKVICYWTFLFPSPHLLALDMHTLVLPPLSSCKY